MSCCARCLLLMAVFFHSGVLMNVQADDWLNEVQNCYAENDGIKLHYAKAGSGPLIVFIHGFPDFWYSWHHQMKGLAGEYTVVAMDTRGYNLSDQPAGAENYDMSVLVADVAAVVRAEQVDRAVIVGHDWGGAIAWAFAAQHPSMTERLVIVNLPHMAGLARELMKEDSPQHRSSAYARIFQREDSHKALNPTMLAGLVAPGQPKLQEKYVQAFERSSFEAMMNYYRRNYPRQPYQVPAMPKIEVPVLQFHGLDDTALLAPALNQTWEHLAKDWTLMTLPGVSHWAHHQAPELITETIRWWLRVPR